MSQNPQNLADQEKAKPALVPKLRFPEFRETEGWSSGPLKNALSSISNGLALGQGSIASGYRVTRIETISAGTIDLAKIGWIQTSEDISAYKLKVGDILLSNINSVAHIGKSVFVDRDYDLHHGMNLLRLEVNRNQHDPKFIFYAINTDWIRAALRERANKAVNQASINQTELGKSEVSLPLRPEQQKIAECLRSVDDLLDAQARKVDALKTHKKGLMQQLFPREGDTQPRLRFPEFQNAGEWAVRTMGSLASFSSGGTPSKDNPKYWNGSIPWVSASSMYDLVIEGADHYVTPLAIGNGTRIAKKGAILILVRGSMLFKRVPICIAGVDVAFNQDVKALDVEASIDTGFLLYQLSAFQARFPINETGIGAGKIELDHLKGFELFIPETHEQHRIASCLRSLDALITAETQKLESLKTHKNGLMQQLFPSPEEATP